MMKLTVNMLKSSDSMNLLSYFSKSKDKVYKKYIDIITTNEFDELCIEAIDRLKNKDLYEEDIEAKFGLELSCILNDYIKEKLNDSVHLKSVISSIVEKSNIEDASKTFKKISNILEKYEIDAQIDVFIELISESKKFKAIINALYSNHEDKKIVDDVYLKYAFDAYSMYDVNAFEQNEVIDNKNTRISLNEKDSLKLYFNDFKNYELLSFDDEQRLAKLMELGENAKKILSDKSYDESDYKKLKDDVKRGEEARELFINSNLKLVINVARSYLNMGVPLQDLIQDGNVGLLRAVERFDYRRGFKFSTYATWWINQTILRGIRDTSKNIRIPVYLADKIYKYNKLKSELAQKLGHRPTEDEVSKHLRIAKSTIRDYEMYNLDIMNLDEPIGDGKNVLADIIPSEESSPEEDYLKEGLKDDIKRILDANILDEREKNILILRYGLNGNDPMTLDEVGKIYNVTRERIRQKESKAISKIVNNRFSKAILLEYAKDPNYAKKKIDERNEKMLAKYQSQKKNSKEKSIYSYLLPQSRYSVDKAASKVLTEKDYKFIEEIYGTRDFACETMLKEISALDEGQFKYIIKKISDECKKNTIYTKNLRKKYTSFFKKKLNDNMNIYALLPMFDKKDIDNYLLKRLGDKELALLQKRSGGTDLTKVALNSLDTKEILEFDDLILEMYKILHEYYEVNDIKEKTKISDVYDISDDEIRENADKYLTSTGLNLLIRYNGGDVCDITDRKTSLSDEELKSLNDEIKNMIYSIKNNNYITGNKFKRRTLFEILPGSMSEIETYVLPYLLEEEVDLLIKKSGSDDITIINDDEKGVMSVDDGKIFQRIRIKGMRLLKEKNENIYTKKKTLPFGVSVGLIKHSDYKDEVLNNLTDDEKALIMKKNGTMDIFKYIDGEKMNAREIVGYYKIVKKYRNMIEKEATAEEKEEKLNSKYGMYDGRNIYDIYKTYPRNLFDFLLLSIEDREKLKEVLGEDYFNQIIDIHAIDYDELENLKTILDKIKIQLIRLNKIKRKPIFEYLSAFKKEDILKAIKMTLSPNEIDFITEYSGGMDYSKVDLNNKMDNMDYERVKSIINRLNDVLISNLSYDSNIKKEINDEVLTFIGRYFSQLETIILCLRLGFNKNKKIYEISEIASALSISESILKTILLDSLKKYRLLIVSKKTVNFTEENIKVLIK